MRLPWFGTSNISLCASNPALTVYGFPLTAHRKRFSVAGSPFSSPRYVLHAPRYALHASRYALHAPRYALHAPRYALHASRYALHASRYALYAPRYALSALTLRSTQNTPHYAPRAKRFTPHKSTDPNLNFSYLYAY
jgi:hypothetical protein